MQTNETLCDATFKAVSTFKVPIYGLPNTLHESKALEHGVPFIPEAFVDVNYNAQGQLLGVPGSRNMDATEIQQVTKQLATEGRIPAADHTPVDVGVSGGPFTICLHSDFANCIENVKAARKAVDMVNKGVQ